MAREYDGPAGTKQEERDAYIFAVIQASKSLLGSSKGHKTTRSRLRQTIRMVLFYWYDLAEKRMSDPRHSYSVNARSSLASEISDVICTYDHVVPVNLLVDQLLSREFAVAADVRGFLDQFYRTCWITSEEDELLNSKKFRQKMPDGWGWETGDIWARYDTAGIGVALEERK